MSANEDMTAPPQHVVIAGAGIMGLSTAYYLCTNFNVTCTLVDMTGRIAPAASGKAGGFLALDWNDGTATEQLTRRSFQLHQELADTFGASTIQYRRLTCVAASVVVHPNLLSSSKMQRPSGKKLQTVEWADERVVQSVRTLGTESTIAQVHPKLLCEQLWKKCQSAGCTLQKGKVIEAIHTSDTGILTGAKLETGQVIPANAVVFACGPWRSKTVGATSTMLGVKYHSAIVPTDKLLSQCVFFSGCGDPEVYVRPDQTAYCTGFPEEARVVTEQPGDEHVDPDRIATILQAVRQASSSTAAATTSQDDNGNHNDDGATAVVARGTLSQDPLVEQACYLPTTPDGIPIMGQVRLGTETKKGVYVVAGHSCWGILLGPASGEAMANLIVTGKSTPHVDLKRFDPSRYR